MAVRAAVGEYQIASCRVSYPTKVSGLHAYTPTLSSTQRLDRLQSLGFRASGLGFRVSGLGEVLPTLPRTRRLDRLHLLTGSSPKRIRARMAVEAVFIKMR